MLHVTHGSGYDYTKVRMVLPDGKKMELTRFYIGTEIVNSYGTKLIFIVPNIAKDSIFRQDVQQTEENAWLFEEIESWEGPLYISCPIVIRGDDNAHLTSKIEGSGTRSSSSIIDLFPLSVSLIVKGVQVPSFCDVCGKKPTEGVCPDINELDKLSLTCLSNILMPEDGAPVIVDPNKIAVIDSTGGLTYVEATSLTGEEMEDI